jgi:formylglycine-generating enzyme required for sulfatase activity
VQVAEVFLGGLLKPKSEQIIEPDTNPDDVEYEFIELEIRDIFLEDAPVSDSSDVLHAVSEYVAQQLGVNLKDFMAMLKTPEKTNEKQRENIKPFAEITARILRQLGTDYAELAEQLETAISGDDHRFKGLEGFPPIQELTFEAVTISVEDDDVNYNLQSFDFEVALITVNESNITNPIEVADNLVFSQTEKHLTEVEQLIIQETISNKTYEQIAASSNYSTQELRDVAGKLWKILSTALGAKVNKTNFKNVIQRQANNYRIEILRSRKTANCFIEDVNGVQLEMVSIPEGNFKMGSLEDEPERFSDESPQHPVTVPAFFMGKYTVTQAQWKAVVSLPQVNRELKPDPSRFKGANRPVERVSWYDAVEFCQRLTAHTKREYRLPSEAEWEYACRAGTTTPFHFGETITSELANYDANSIYGRGVKGTYREQTTPVGSFNAANNFGLYDMHANVWEWCLDDWHDNYEGAPIDGIAWFNDNDNLSQKQGRAVLRGGSWFINPRYCRSASRNFYRRALRDLINGYIGFRVVCAVGRILR